MIPTDEENTPVVCCPPHHFLLPYASRIATCQKCGLTKTYEPPDLGGKWAPGNKDGYKS